MENRNLQWNKRVKVPLILIFSVNTNHESVAYRSFVTFEFKARGARKVTTGIRLSRIVPGPNAWLGPSSAIAQAVLAVVTGVCGLSLTGRIARRAGTDCRDPRGRAAPAPGPTVEIAHRGRGRSGPSVAAWDARLRDPGPLLESNTSGCGELS